MKLFKFVIFIFFFCFLIGCETIKISEIELSVNEVNATSVSIKDNNDGFLYKDQLNITLYKDNEKVKIIDNYQIISELTPDTDYTLKYNYFNGEINVDKELSFKTLKKSEITLSVSEVLYDKVKIGSNNNDFYYLDTLKVELYQNNTLIRKLNEYSTIFDLEPNTEYLIKYKYYNGEEEVNKELPFKTKALEEINLNVIDVGKNNVGLGIDNQEFTYMDTLEIKLYEGDKLVKEITDYTIIEELIINTPYRIEYEYYNGIENISKELTFRTKNHSVLSEDNSISIYLNGYFFYVQHVKVSVNEEVVLDIDTEEPTLTIENLKETDKILIEADGYHFSTYYKKANILYYIDLEYSKYFLETFRYDEKFYGLSDLNKKDLIFQNKVAIDGFVNTISIYDEAFMNNQIIESVTFESDIEVGEKAFYNCDNLKKINFNDKSVEFENEAFANCDGLEELDFRNYVFMENSDIEQERYDTNTSSRRIFADCKSLKKVYLAVNQNLHKFMFEGCINLTEVVNIETIKVFSSGVFTGCEKLENVTINSECISIRNGAFYGCSSLKEVFVGKECRVFYGAFFNCPQLVIKTDASERPEIWLEVFEDENCEILYNQVRS